jgi:hypothetical protein
VLCVLPGFRFYYQYWILFFPILVLALPGIISLQQRAFLYIIPVALLLHLFLAKGHYFPNNVDEKMDQIFDGQNFSSIKKLSKALERSIQKTDDIVILGAMPQPYLYTNKNPKTPHIWTTMISLDNQVCADYRNQLLQYIKDDKPKYVVFSYCSYHWILQNQASKDFYKSLYQQVNLAYKPFISIDTKNKKLSYQSSESIVEARDKIVIYELR